MNDDGYNRIKKRIVTHIRHTLEYCDGLSQEDFMKNRQLQEACVFNVLQIGELAAKVIEMQLDLDHPEIVWRQMRGMRNRIVHDYDGIKLSIVWDTIKEDFPELLARLEE